MITDEQKYEELMQMSEISSSGSDVEDLLPYGYEDYEDETFSTEEEIEAKKAKEERAAAVKNDSHAGKPTNDAEVEERFVSYQRFSKRRVHKYTETEMAAIRKSCEGVIVRDYSANDPYHWDNQKAASMDSLHEMNDEINALRKIFRSPDEYVVAMRTLRKAWGIIEKNFNTIHTTKEFFEMVGSGKIVNSRLIMPKLVHRDRYDTEILARYISNLDLDPKDLLTDKAREAKEKKELAQKLALAKVTDDAAFDRIISSCAGLLSSIKNLDDDFYDDGDDDKSDEPELTEEEMEQEVTETVMTPEELQMIDDMKDEPPQYMVKELSRKEIRGYNESMRYGRKRLKKHPSRKQRIRQFNQKITHGILKTIQESETDPTNGRFFVAQGLFELPDKIKNDADEFFMNGSLASNANDELFDIMMREKFREMTPDESDGYHTIGDIELSEFFQQIDKHPIFNAAEIRRRMDATPESLRREDEKKSLKDNKRMERIVLDRIVKLNRSSKFKKMATKTEKLLAKDIEEG